MGRELKRVPLDFDWPLHKVWQGFKNPHYGECSKCRACDGTGYSPEARKLYQMWWGYVPFRPEDNGCTPYTKDTPHVRQFAERQCACSPDYYGSGELAIQREARRIATLWNESWCHHLNEQDVADLVAADRLPWDFTRTPRTPEQALPENLHANGWTKTNNGYIPSALELSIYTCGAFGGSNMEYTLIKARCARMGVSTECSACEGEGSIWPSPEAKQAAEDWKDIEPPIGDGYQMWETVSEGSPISPVFASPEELATYLSTGEHDTLSDASYHQWLAMIRGPGWAPSAVSTLEAGFQTGVQAMGDRELAKQ